MRVLVLASTFPRWSGDQQPAFIQDFCRALPDCDVHVLVPGAEGAASHEQVDGVQVHRFRYAPLARWEMLAYRGGMLANVRENPILFLLLPVYLGAMLLAGWRLARREEIDIVHAHWIIPQGVVGALLRCLLPRTRLVVTAHGGDAYAFDGLLGCSVKRLVLRRADRVTAVSTPLRDDLQRDLQLAIAPAVAPMGVDLARCDIHAGPRQARFCFVGRLVEKKGVSQLLNAYARSLAVAGDDFPSLLIAGNGPLLGTLQAQAAQLGVGDRVEFSGWVDPAAVLQRMAESLAVLVPSITSVDGDREGLGLVAVEALTVGTPVIAYDYGAIRDIVQDGINGVLVPQADIDALARALLAAATGQLPVITAQQRDAIRARFDLQAVGRGYRTLYQRLLSG